MLVNHQDLIGELEDHQQIRGVGVLFPWLIIAAVAVFVLDLTGHIALLRGRGACLGIPDRGHRGGRTRCFARLGIRGRPVLQQDKLIIG